MARLVSLRFPVPKRVRRDLPVLLRVLTADTLTLKIFSIASLISVLVAARVNLEGVLALIDQGVALLAHDGAEDNVSGVFVPGNGVNTHYLPPLSVFEATKASRASAVKMMSSEFKTS